MSARELAVDVTHHPEPPRAALQDPGQIQPPGQRPFQDQIINHDVLNLQGMQQARV